MDPMREKRIRAITAAYIVDAEDSMGFDFAIGAKAARAMDLIADVLEITPDMALGFHDTDEEGG